MMLSERPIYSAATVRGAIGMDENRFQWMSRQFLVPELEIGSGRGSRRLWSAYGILRIGVAAFLADHGVKLPYAHEFAGTLLSYGNSPGDFSYFVGIVQGESGYYVVGTEQKAWRTLAELAEAIPADTEVVVVVNVGKIASDIRAHLESLSI